MQSLQDIIDSLPPEFIEKVNTCENVAELQDILWITDCDDKQAVIIARIAHLNHLVI